MFQKFQRFNCFERLKRFELKLSSPGQLRAKKLSRNPRNLVDVMLSSAKHLAFSGGYEVGFFAFSSA
jgi:hypothetical protein